MENLCYICPRNCGADRTISNGFCKAGTKIKIAKVMIHHFEEPIISGESNSCRGSGAIFFSGCSLGCVYCQNFDISRGTSGKEITEYELAKIFKKLEDAGAYNINLVTPTHYTKEIISALKIYKPKIPIVWNTSGYEKPETIKMLDGYVDIFLTDFKYFYKKTAKMYSFAENYAEFCKKSLILMRKIIPNDIIKDGLMQKGIIVRHLALPGQTEESINILQFIYDNLGKDTIVSLMSQYVPTGDAKNFPEINRKIKPLEYKILVKKLNSLGMKNCYIQEASSASLAFTPDFNSHDGDIEFWYLK